jgi:hypothetical protein
MNAGSLLRRIRIDMNWFVARLASRNEPERDRVRVEPLDRASDDPFKVTSLVAAAPAPIDVRRQTCFDPENFT